MLRWLRNVANEAKKGAAPAKFEALQVAGRGMCCSLGHSAPAATAALNARLTHFQESRFVGEGGRPIQAAMLHGVDVWGMERLGLMLSSVIAEALGSGCGDRSQGEVALLVCYPESQRPGLAASTFRQGVEDVVLPWGFHPNSVAMDCGKGGIAEALQKAGELLRGRTGEAPPPRQVLLVGLDSLLVAGAIEQLLNFGRILGPGNADGLVPAEGAAALLLERPASAVVAQGAALRIEAAELALDEWRMDGAAPLRGTGLTKAVRAALVQARTSMSDLDFQISGFNGEGWYAREITLMQSRCMATRRDHYAHLTPCQSLGDAGAAGPVLALAWLAELLGREPGMTPGQSALAHFAGDDGRRSALVLRHGPATAAGMRQPSAQPH